MYSKKNAYGAPGITLSQSIVTKKSITFLYHKRLHTALVTFNTPILNLIMVYNFYF